MAGIFKFRCPHCYREYTGIDELRGNLFDCVQCGEELLVPVNPEDLHSAEENKCPACGGELDLLGECPACEKKARAAEAAAAEEEKKKPGKGKKIVSDPVMAKVMKARRPGMKNVIPEEKGSEEAAKPVKRTRRRRR